MAMNYHQDDPFVQRLRNAFQNAPSQQIGSSDFDLNDGAIAPDMPLRNAGVLLALQRDHNQKWIIWLTRRAQSMRIHAGQIALPGGKMDECDPSPTDAALREAKEEIGLPAALTHQIGQLPIHRTVTNFRVHPLVAIIDDGFIPPRRMWRGGRGVCRANRALFRYGSLSDTFAYLAGAKAALLLCPFTAPITSGGQRRAFWHNLHSSVRDAD